MTTHFKPRGDAIAVGRGRDRRDYVPTVYGRGKDRDTIWIDSWQQFRDAGGAAHFNEDQTEIVLTLPERYKFSIRFQCEGK